MCPPRTSIHIALLVVGAMVGGQLGHAIHYALVKHAVCAEHGALVHVDDHDADSSQLPSHAVSAAPAGADHHHDDCLLAPLNDRPSSVVAGQAIATPQLASEHAQAAASAPAPRAPLGVAPKTSPPTIG